MATSPLLLQIASRTAAFLQNTGVSQARLCRHLSISDSSLSQFLHGTKSLDPSVIIKLVQTLNLSHHEVAEKFSEPVRTAKLMHLQESVMGQPAQMRLDGNDGWVSGQSGIDPNGTGGIDDVPDADTHYDQATIDLLRQVRGYHRKSIRAINDYIQKAKANRDGSTPIPADAPKFSR